MDATSSDDILGFGFWSFDECLVLSFHAEKYWEVGMVLSLRWVVLWWGFHVSISSILSVLSSSAWLLSSEVSWRLFHVLCSIQWFSHLEARCGLSLFTLLPVLDLEWFCCIFRKAIRHVQYIIEPCKIQILILTILIRIDHGTYHQPKISEERQVIRELEAMWNRVIIVLLMFRL